MPETYSSSIAVAGGKQLPAPLPAARARIVSRGAIAAGLCAVWALIGLTGHEPWKPDEAYSFGLVLDGLHSGNWVVPTLGGEPFMEKPPIFFMTAGLFARLAGAWLPLHDAARLATGFYLLLTLLCVSLAAGELAGRAARVTAPLLFISCLGLFELSHRLQTDMALMAGVALGFYGIALAPRAFRRGGLWIGTGAGLGFLAKGLIGPGLVGVSAIAVLVLPRMRSRAYLASWAWALLAILPWVLIWPLMLLGQSPDLFHVWLFDNNFDRFMQGPHTGLGPRNESGFYTRVMTWFAFPALPVALTALLGRRSSSADSAWAPGAVSFLSMLACLAIAHDARCNYALPLLPPLAVFAASTPLGERARRAWYWTGLSLYAVIAILLWAVWFTMLMDWPLPWVRRLHELEPGFTETLRPLAVTVAAALTAAALWLLWRMRRQNAAWAWAIGMTLFWGLGATLAMPAVDYGRSYRSVMMDLAPHLESAGCIASRGLGEPQRALLEYYAGRRTLREEIDPDARCELLLVQQGRTRDRLLLRKLFDDQVRVPRQPFIPVPDSARWAPIWTGRRPGEDFEQFTLYRRE